MNSRLDPKTRRYTEAYNNYYPLVFSVVQGKIGNVIETEDICQEVFMRFYEKFDEVQNHRTWLQGALRLVVFEHYKARRRTGGEVDESLEDIFASSRKNFHDTRIMIEQAIEEIERSGDERDGVLFELVAVNNYTYKEAGRQLGMRERQARYRYGLVVNRLARYLEERGIQKLEELL